MAVSDELVYQVARAIGEDATRRINALFDNDDGSPLLLDEDWVNGEGMEVARAAIAALSTPDFVLPLAEEMLRSKSVYAVELQTAAVALRDQEYELLELEETLLDAYREAKGE